MSDCEFDPRGRLGVDEEGMRDKALIGNGNGQTAAYGNVKAKQDKRWG